MTIRDMRDVPGRAQPHTFRRFVFPNLHRLAENAGLDLCSPYTGRRRATRTRARDCPLVRKIGFVCHTHAFGKSLEDLPRSPGRAVSTKALLLGQRGNGELRCDAQRTSALSPGS